MVADKGAFSFSTAAPHVLRRGGAGWDSKLTSQPNLDHRCGELLPTPVFNKVSEPVLERLPLPPEFDLT